MPLGNQEKIGFLPALEMLPFFGGEYMLAADVRPVAFASYGSIAREMLVGNLAGGVMPWEIFASEVLALPGQRDKWTVAFFMKPSPAELVLQTHIHKSIHSGCGGAPKKVPARLQIGIESRNSLTRLQFLKWLEKVNPSPKPEIIFKFLPMDQRLQGLPSDALDGFIARSPWGQVAEERNLGTLVKDFSQTDVNQLMVNVCKRDSAARQRLCAETTLAVLSAARTRLSGRTHLENAAARMDASGRPRIPFVFLAIAAKAYGVASQGIDIPASISRITSELKELHRLDHLPPQIAASTQTARLLAYA